jgi:hypothetical protein
VGEPKEKSQVSPPRFAPEGMTNLFRSMTKIRHYRKLPPPGTALSNNDEPTPSTGLDNSDHWIHSNGRSLFATLLVTVTWHQGNPLLAGTLHPFAPGGLSQQVRADRCLPALHSR